MTATLLAETDGRGVATLTFNRPDRGNAYDQALLAALAAEIARLSDDAAVRIIVLRGAGKHFCAGADIGGQASAPPADNRVTLPGVCHALDAVGKPTVALVHGACMGGGLAFAACCDVAIATRDAVFALPEVRLGFAPGPLVPFLLRAMTPRSLRRYLVSGERFGAEEALRIGLVHELAETADADAALARQIDELLRAGPNAAASAKQALRRLGNAPTMKLIAELQTEFQAGFDSAEAQEGRASFREKRKPSWAPK
ncbi:MAG TPA: enoyl-CoA hydratase-related protein [Xanthobacteraceae bacterium]|nr:enoyl-CoA hydratase-related protein [Xanthobacteraceae bacterium]